MLDGSVPDDPGAAVVEVDAEVGADAVARLEAGGAYTVCYISAGSWEEWRPDADAFPAEVLGEALDEWPGERYVDLRRLDVLAPLWGARLDACAAAGFDAVDPDNVDSFENDSGFDLTADDAAAAVRWLAEAAHERGMAMGLKNAPGLVPLVGGEVDFAVVEQCLQYGFCGDYAPLVAAGKPVFAVEYRDEGATLAEVCAAVPTGFSMLLADYALDSPGARCP